MRRGFVLPGDREVLSQYSTPDLMDDVPLKVYQAAASAMTLWERHNRVRRCNEKLHLEMIKKDDEFKKETNAAQRSLARMKEEVEDMKVLYERNTKNAEERASRAEELRAHSQKELETVRSEMSAELKKVKSHLASMISEASKREKLLAETLEVSEAEKKKALEEERERVSDTASDMLWNTQRAGFEMGVRVVYDNYPQPSSEPPSA